MAYFLGHPVHSASLSNTNSVSQWSAEDNGLDCGSTTYGRRRRGLSTWNLLEENGQPPQNDPCTGVGISRLATPCTPWPEKRSTLQMLSAKKWISHRSRGRDWKNAVTAERKLSLSSYTRRSGVGRRKKSKGALPPAPPLSDIGFVWASHSDGPACTARLAHSVAAPPARCWFQWEFTQSSQSRRLQRRMPIKDN